MVGTWEGIMGNKELILLKKSKNQKINRTRKLE